MEWDYLGGSLSLELTYTYVLHRQHPSRNPFGGSPFEPGRALLAFLTVVLGCSACSVKLCDGIAFGPSHEIAKVVLHSMVAFCARVSVYARRLGLGARLGPSGELSCFFVVQK